MKRSAKLVLVKDGRVLMVQGAKDSRWTFPGGKQKRFEKPNACLLREAAEKLPQVPLQKVGRWKKLQRRTPKGKTRQVVYRARYTGGTLEGGDTSELVRAEWRYLNGTRFAPTAQMVTRKLFGCAE
jgi:8-oxo-dGTP diphosphatase